MKKKFIILLLALCLISLYVCRDKKVSGNSDDTTASSYNENTTTEADSNHSAQEKINDEGDYAISATVAAPDKEPEKDSTEENNNNIASKDTENDDSNINVELVDGMRPEFKEAMDSYEAFYDEYCDFMKKYMANPTDLTLLSGYADMLTRLSDMDEKFKTWEGEDLNDAELKYYLDVINRINQKLLEVYE